MRLIRTAVFFAAFMVLFLPAAFCGNAESVIVPAQDNVKQFDWPPAALISADIALAGAAAYMIYFELKTFDEYNSLYAEINNTTETNYEKLQKKQKELYAVRSVEAAAACLASLALIYTLGDIFINHEIFKQDEGAALKGALLPGGVQISIIGRF